jgi:hypothetical protein
VGQEKSCTLDYNGRTFDGKALLETSELLFRGGTRLKIAFNDITRVEASDGRLRIDFSAGTATFHLGDAAPKWAGKILHPPSRLDKLGIKEGMRISWIGAPDPDFQNEANLRGALFYETNPDLTFLAASNPSDLDKLPDPPVWVVYPKGVQHIREIDVINAGRAAGLTDVKVARFSPTHTALKFVARKQ